MQKKIQNLIQRNPQKNRDILSKQFEIILTIEGTTQETANTIQVTIYLFTILSLSMNLFL